VQSRTVEVGSLASFDCGRGSPPATTFEDDGQASIVLGHVHHLADAAAAFAGVGEREGKRFDRGLLVKAFEDGGDLSCLRGPDGEEVYGE
jgi:hypothetical protein